MFAYIARFIVRHPRLVVALCLTGVIWLGAGLRKLEIDRSFDALIRRGVPDRDFLESMKDVFGSDEIVVAALVTDDVFAPPTLGKVKALSAALAAVPGVVEVKSLATANHIERAGDGVRVGPLFREVPTDAASLADLRRKALSDPILCPNIVSTDGRATALVVYFEAATDRDPKLQFPATEAVDAIARGFAGPEEVYVSGGPLNKVANSQMARRDLRILVPLLVFVNALILALIYRSVRGLVLPVIVIIAAVVATLGLMGHAGTKLHPFAMFIPVFVIMLAAAYSVHTMTAYYQAVGQAGARAGAPRERRSAVIESLLRDHLPPFAVVVLTTVVGFASVGTSAIPATGDLGVYTALGALLLYPLCGFLLPAALCIMDLPKRLPPKPREARGQWLWNFLARAAVHRPLTMLGCWAIATGLSIWGATRIEVTMNSLEMLPTSHPLRISEDAIQERLGATAVLSVFVGASEPHGAVEPASIARFARLQAFAAGLPEVDRAVSLIDILDRLKTAFADDPPEAPRGDRPAAARAPALPRTREEAEELLLVYSYPDDLRRLVDEDRSMLRLVLRLNTQNSSDMKRVVARIKEAALSLGYADGAVELNSTRYMITTSLDDVAYQMAISIFTSVVVIVPIMVFLAGSVRTGLIATIPNVVPSFFVFGFMGLFGYRLDTSTSTVASITLGIAVDDTILFLARFRKLREEGHSVVSALETALREIGPAMILAAGILSTSLLFLNVSDFKPNRNLAQIASFGFFACVLGDLTLLPSLIALFAPRHWKGAAVRGSEDGDLAQASFAAAEEPASAGVSERASDTM